jgi:hypothetical protein
MIGVSAGCAESSIANICPIGLGAPDALPPETLVRVGLAPAWNGIRDAAPLRGAVAAPRRMVQTNRLGRDRCAFRDEVTRLLRTLLAIALHLPLRRIRNPLRWDRCLSR